MSFCSAFFCDRVLFFLFIVVGFGAVHWIAPNGRDQMPCNKLQPCASLSFVASRVSGRQPLTVFCSGVFSGQSLTAFGGDSLLISSDDGKRCEFHGNGRGTFLQVASPSVSLQDLWIGGYGSDQLSPAVAAMNQVMNATNCTFQGNSASAIVATGGSISLYNCTFLGNTALGTGNSRKRSLGGALAFSSVTAFIADSFFKGNKASDSGGAISCSGSSCRVIACSFSGNVAPEGSVISNSCVKTRVVCFWFASQKCVSFSQRTPLSPICPSALWTVETRLTLEPCTRMEES